MYIFFIHFSNSFYMRLAVDPIPLRSVADQYFEFLIRRVPEGNEIEMMRDGRTARRQPAKGPK